MPDPHDHRTDEDIENILRDLTPADTELVEPPTELWSRIEAAVSSETTRPVESGDAEIVSLPRARQLRTLPLVAAAAAVLIIVLGIVAVASRDGGDPTVLAVAELAYDPDRFDELGADAAARASLLESAGVLLIDIDPRSLPDAGSEDADLEVWLIRPDAQGNPSDLVSLGLLESAGSDRFEIPADYDPEIFSVVDISIEPRDGDAGHSGRSILRGVLDRA